MIEPKMTKKSTTDSTKSSASKTRRLQSKRQRRLLTNSRIFRYGVRNFTRNSWLTVAATAVMSITLLIMFSTIVVSQMLSSTVVSLREKIDISIYLDPSISDDTLRNLKGKMQLVDNVRSVAVSNSKQQYQDYVTQYPDKLETLVTLTEQGIDPSTKFPAVMNVKVNDLSNLTPIKQVVGDDPQFKQWLYANRAPSYAGEQQNTINRIASWASFAKRIGLILGSVFLVISVLVIFNTIRMAIFSRRDEISMMRSVGADRHFVRGPFLIEAELYGALAAVVATALGYFLFIWITPGLEAYGIATTEVRDILSNWMALIFVAVLAVGILIGYVSARLAVRRYLK
ncbi:MAG: cell division protein FtsX [Sphaerimonospora mesophila]